MSNSGPTITKGLLDPALGSSQKPRPPPLRGSSRIAQCTHMTTTRVYNPNFRCTVCLQPGKFGWLYRCTQDRELILENELERGTAPSIDTLPFILPRQYKPPKRGLALRANVLSFFNEVSQEQLKSYTPQQVDIILTQRAHAQEVAHQSETLRDFGLGLQLVGMPSGVGTGSTVNFSSEIEEQQSRPGAPFIECQFKACHNCRWNLLERSWLSLDAVADGEFPPTALTGFGFHFQGARPIGLVKNVRNLGLRPNPPSTPTSKLFSNKTPHTRLTLNSGPPASTGPSANPVELECPFVDENNADTTFGQAGSNAYDSAAMTRKLNADIEGPPDRNGHDIPFHRAIRMMENNTVANNDVTPSHPFKKSEKETFASDVNDVSKHIMSSSDVRPPWTPPVSPSLQPTRGEHVELFELNGGIYGRSDQSLKTNLSLRNLYDLESTLAHHDGDVGLFLPVTNAHLAHAAAIPLPPEIMGELTSPDKPARDPQIQQSTVMEIAESNGAFGKVPHELAVTEEAVEQHVPDIIIRA